MNNPIIVNVVLQVNYGDGWETDEFFQTLDCAAAAAADLEIFDGEQIRILVYLREGATGTRVQIAATSIIGTNFLTYNLPYRSN